MAIEEGLFLVGYMKWTVISSQMITFYYDRKKSVLVWGRVTLETMRNDP